MIGFFEGLDSERGIAWRLADSLMLRKFLAIGLDKKRPDHVTISRTRRLIDAKNINGSSVGFLSGGAVRPHQRQNDRSGFDNAGSQRGDAIDRAPRYRRKLQGYLKCLAEAEGIDAKHAGALLRMDRERKKKTSNEDWNSPGDEDALITKLKDGLARLKFGLSANPNTRKRLRA